ncbi:MULTISPECIES: helix-turn-helix domain-containing protein [unclassified Streptomyces]|uniref:helix-turn-helix domain-containing protein n=1 Tax=unclassified Streptomyces TaxID=2593676 RepID=UPI00386F3CCD
MSHFGRQGCDSRDRAGPGQARYRLLTPRRPLEAAERFRQGDENTVIAHDLRVSVRSVQRWRKAWSQDGPRALASKGPASLALLSDELFAVLEREPAKGPVARVAGPDVDPVADQDADRAPLSQELHRARGGRPGLVQGRRVLAADLPALPGRPARWAQKLLLEGPMHPTSTRSRASGPSRDAPPWPIVPSPTPMT